jgi:hypothetical protein
MLYGRQKRVVAQNDFYYIIQGECTQLWDVLGPLAMYELLQSPVRTILLGYPMKPA